LTEQYLMLRMMLSSLYAILMAYHLLLRRYRNGTTYLIMAVEFLLTLFLNVPIVKYVERGQDLRTIYIFAVEILTLQIMTMLLNQHRDARALIVGFTSCTFSLAGYVISSLGFTLLKSMVAAVVLQLLFYNVALLIIIFQNKETPLSNLLSNKTARGRLCWIPILNFLLISLLSIWPLNLFQMKESRLLCITALIMMVINYCLVVSFLRVRERRDLLLRNNELLENCAEDLRRQMKHTERAQREIAILRHDMRHRDQMISCYLDEGNIDAIREMLTQTDALMEKTQQQKYCDNAVLNSVLSQTAVLAGEMNIAFQCGGNVPELPQRLEFEVGTVVLNLLENAMNAAGKIAKNEPRFVRFFARSTEGRLAVEISNSYCGKLKLGPDGLPLSERGAEHGYGLRSVLGFAEKNGASFDCEIQERVFTVRLLIGMRNDEKTDEKNKKNF
jgi:hypothetical protein